jgi:hypothetical protein
MVMDLWAPQAKHIKRWIDVKAAYHELEEDLQCVWERLIGKLHECWKLKLCPCNSDSSSMTNGRWQKVHISLVKKCPSRAPFLLFHGVMVSLDFNFEQWIWSDGARDGVDYEERKETT